MNHIIKFSQRAVIDKITLSLPTKGICFRLTFKWAACTLAGGRFKYDEANADKTAAKHTEYRKETLAMEATLKGDFSDSQDFAKYVDLDHKETRRFVKQWGAKFTDADKNVFTNLDVLNQTIDPIYDYLKTTKVPGDYAVLGVFYGRNGSSAWGHVVGFCTRGGKSADGPCFFDANSGLWEFDSDENFADSIRSYIRNVYLKGGRTIEAFNTIVVKMK